jgi:hypothetical protein
MKRWKVTVKTRTDKKIDLVWAKTPEAALNKIQKAPVGWHWKSCSCQQTEGELWCASVRTETEFYHFKI